jgi:hypothetical protein
MKREYVLVQGRDNDLKKRVDLYLRDGWDLVGGPIFLGSEDDGSSWFAQALFISNLPSPEDEVEREKEPRKQDETKEAASLKGEVDGTEDPMTENKGELQGEIIGQSKDLGVRGKGRALKKIKLEDLLKIANKVSQDQVGKIKSSKASVEPNLMATRGDLVGIKRELAETQAEKAVLEQQVADLRRQMQELKGKEEGEAEG